MNQIIKQYLMFRKQFTRREWHELNVTIETRLKEKADQLELDDLDIQIIEERLPRVISQLSE
ncbi:TPA: hypothetical protein VBA75_001999 [Streptococcus agalactiae]|uniref:hypothetical protein n=1 Tax=Streptococcus agalactiae TaxID=1311 RepID=UPI000332DF3A|nr:hypothetical protein [Streptococcus agalactiae]QBX20672.1 hypothetical protein Javan53_0013 [Streptococcus phage Javan53]OTG48774.1 hypothetical protein B7934_03215 [Streptococcus agalactiae]OTG53456.1 hypothetical protein B7931_02985 [Streptococcus agalactiae]CCW39581.1 DNA, complete genome [Streptococcus agalactiae ILRI005]HEO6665835.1 hypothetical protein [Streptococcus agalactiae]